MSTDPLAKKRKIADGSAVPAVEQFQTTDDENSQNDDDTPFTIQSARQLKSDTFAIINSYEQRFVKLMESLKTVGRQQQTETVTNDTSTNDKTQLKEQRQPVEIMQSIVDLDKKLKMYIVQCQHQKRQLEQRKVVQKLMKDREQSLTDVCNDLRQIEDSLTTALNDAKFCLPSNDTETRKIEVESALIYAQKISYSAFAPMNWTPGQPLRKFRPPYPTDELLANSILHKKLRGLTSEPSVVTEESIAVPDLKLSSSQIKDEMEIDENNDEDEEDEDDDDDDDIDDDINDETEDNFDNQNQLASNFTAPEQPQQQQQEDDEDDDEVDWE